MGQGAIWSMIWEKLIDVMFLPLQALVDLLPTVTSAPPVPVESFIGVIQYSAYFFPMGTLAFIILNWGFWYSAHIIWAVIEWVYKKIPGVS